MTDSKNTDDENYPQMECNRCGVCCEKFQAIVSLEEIQVIAGHLGISSEEWVKQYSEPRWPGNRNYLIRHGDNGCIFHSYHGEVSSCSIHTHRPSCCSDWQSSLEKPECQEGMRKAGK